jgi:hypothetical protein
VVPSDLKLINSLTMKKTLISLILLSVLIIGASSQQVKVQKNEPAGIWKFEAPSAPQEYSSGTLEVGFADKILSATMMFIGFGYKFPGESVKILNDSIHFSVNIQGQEINISLKIHDPVKMTGKAVYSEGEVPLILTKQNIK